MCVDSAGSVKYTRTIGPMKTADFHEQFVPADEYLYISSNKPLMVVHFITAKQLDEIGDSSMIILPSTEHLVNNITFYSLNPNEEDNFIHFVSITVSEEHSDPNFIILNEEPLKMFEYLTISHKTNFGGFVIYRLQLDAGYHTICHSNPSGGFALTVYEIAEKICVWICSRTQPRYANVHNYMLTLLITVTLLTAFSFIYSCSYVLSEKIESI